MTSAPPPKTAPTRAMAAFCAVVFVSAAVAWGSHATLGFWAPTIYRIRSDPRDVIPGVIAAALLLIAFQFARGAIVPDYLPWGVGKRPRTITFARLGVHALTAILLAFMGFVLWTMVEAHPDYPVFDGRGRVTGHADPMMPWMAPLQLFSGLSMIVLGCFALITGAKQFLSSRRHRPQARVPAGDYS